MALDLFAIEQRDDGRWVVIELLQHGSVTHHRVLPEVYDTEDEAEAKVGELSASKR